MRSMFGSIAGLLSASVGVSIALGAASAFAAPKTYSIELSLGLRAEVDLDEQRRAGTVRLLERTTGKLLLVTSSEGLEIDETAVQVGPAGDELPYAGQGIVQYDDFDFDGRRDVAILAGHDSCYGGPSYRVFLREGAGFRASEPFTRLARDFCGMFRVDPVRRRLHTFEKDGCCWHSSQEYGVVARVPRLVSEVELDTSGAYAKTTRRSPGRPQRVEHALQADLVERVVLTFALAGKNGQRLVLFAAGRELDCALVQGDESRVQLSYRLDSGGSLASVGPRFSLAAPGTELSYHAKGYRLVVHDGPDRLGVTVVRGGKATFLAGVPDTREGRLTELLPSDFDNLGETAP